MKRFLILLVACYSVVIITTKAQDRVIKNIGDTIKCKVTEIGADEIKYFYPDNEKLIFGIDKALVDHIEFGTGEVIKIENETYANPEYYVGQSRNALKLGFLNPMSDNYEIVYERNLKPGRSMEYAVGIIGFAFDPYECDAKGGYLKLSYKFIRKPDFYFQRMHYSHIMKGAYIAPEIAFRYLSYDPIDWDIAWDEGSSNANSGREDDFSFAVNVKFGKQWVIDDGFLVDIYFGVGYGMGTNDNYDVFNYGFVAGDNDVPLSITGGVRLGWVFGKKKKQTQHD